MLATFAPPPPPDPLETLELLEPPPPPAPPAPLELLELVEPFELLEAESFVMDQVTSVVTFHVAPLLYIPVATNVWVSPTTMLATTGVTFNAVRTAVAETVTFN
jgi:hypothetical protein